MNRIVQAVNVMILYPNKISKPIKSPHGLGYFFKYDDKFIWSIREVDGDFYLSYYPSASNLSGIANIAYADWDKEEIDPITYSTDSIRSREGRETFSELHSVVKGSLYKMNTVLDEIIADDN